MRTGIAGRIPREWLLSHVPGIGMLQAYDISWLRLDLIAGLSVAAVTIPAAMAYAQLAGLPPATGLYASILPLLVYALFGSSRQLVTGPDSALAALTATSLGSLSGGDPGAYISLAALLAVMVGLLCIAGGLLKLGFLADFLAKPILIGYLNGVALTIIATQLGKVFGYPVQFTGFFRGVYDFVSRLGQTHIPTLTIGLASFVVIMGLKRVSRLIPGALIAVLAATAVTAVGKLAERGVAVVGAVPPGLPALTIPEPGTVDLGSVVLAALGLLLISFSDLILPARGFAAKRGYDIDANQELVALGVANIASGISQGFPISGVSSRTAVNDSAGARTQISGVVSALVVALVLLTLTVPLAYMPVAVLGAVLISAALGLLNIDALRQIHRASLPEFRLSVMTTLGVITIGILPGILIAVGLAMIQVLKRAARPHDALLGVIPGKEGFFDINAYPEAEQIPGLIILKVDSSVLFFNADYLRAKARRLVADANPRWIILDAESIPAIDTTAVDSFEKAVLQARRQGVVLAFARLSEQVREMLDRTGLTDQIGEGNIYRSVRSAVDAFRRQSAGDP